MDAIIGEAGAGAGVAPVLPGIPPHVEAVARRADGTRWLFLLNHNAFEVTVPVPPGAVDALTGRALPALVPLAGRGVLVAAH